MGPIKSQNIITSPSQPLAPRFPLDPSLTPRTITVTIPSDAIPEPPLGPHGLPIRVVDTTYAGRPTFDLWYAVEDVNPAGGTKSIPMRLDGKHSMAPAIRELLHTCEAALTENEGLLARLKALDESEVAALTMDRNQLRDEVEKLREKVSAYEKRPVRGK